MTPAQLKRIRRDLRLTQAQLAEMVGVKRLAVARWEGGARKISEPVARLVRFVHGEVRKAKRKGRRPRRKGSAPRGEFLVGVPTEKPRLSRRRPG